MKGSITIGRWHSGSGQGISVSVRDDISSTTFFSAELTLEDFALLITGRSDVDCEFILRPDFVGKRYEIKSETIFVESPHREFTAEEIRAILEPYEIDGWSGNERDLNNYHKIRPDGIRVGFHRYIDLETGEPVNG